MSARQHIPRLKVRPQRKRPAAAGSDLYPRREGVRTALHRNASSPSSGRRADAADICVLETDLPGGPYGMAEEFTEKLIEKVREYVFLYDRGHRRAVRNGGRIH